MGGSGKWGKVSHSVMKKYALPELPYGYAALEPHYSARLLELHHGKHHAAYVAGANATLEKLAAAREQRDFSAINQLQKNLAFHVSGHVLHSLFWRNMSPRGGGQPAGELAAAVQESFGTFDGLKSQLTEAALNVQGSGWGALAWEPVGQRLVVEQVYDHQGNIGNGTVPLLVLDMWGNRRGTAPFVHRCGHRDVLLEFHSYSVPRAGGTRPCR